MINLRRFFSKQNWWGKIIGSILGFMIAGPVGALFGIFIGNFFDIGLAEHFRRPHWHFHTEQRKEVQNIFFETAFKVMGHIAKADGRVSEQEIQLAKTLMKEMDLNVAQKKLAQTYFNEGKKQDFDLLHCVTAFKLAVKDNPQLVNLFIDIQYRALQVDFITPTKMQVFNTILSQLGLAPLNQQSRFFDDFAYSRNQSHRSSSQNQSNYQSPRQTTLSHAFAILELATTSDKQAVKRAYRRLMSLNHPDKLIAKGLPDSMIKLANEKTQKIRQAYEQICEIKGW